MSVYQKNTAFSKYEHFGTTQKEDVRNKTYERFKKGNNLIFQIQNV